MNAPDKPSRDLTTLEGSFLDYLETMFAGVPIGPQQVLEIKKAYYGAVGWHVVMLESAHKQWTQKQFNAWMEARNLELMNFAMSLGPNKAGQTDEEVAQSSPIILPPNMH